MSTNVLAAIFPDRATAVATRDALGKDHYHFRWLAVTKAAEFTEAHPDADRAPDVHQLAESSDGPVGAVGRFLSGAGASLRKALEDHGVAEADAEAIDAATPATGAVLVVHAPEERTAQAVTTLRQGGGTLYPADGTTPARPRESLSEPEAADRGLIPSYDTTGGDTTAAATSGADEENLLGDYAGVTTSVGSSPQDRTTSKSAPAGVGESEYSGDYAGVTTSVGSSPQDRAASASAASASAATESAATSSGSARSAASVGSDDGEYVIRRRIVTEMATIEVPIEREEVFIERRRP